MKPAIPYFSQEELKKLREGLVNSEKEGPDDVLLDNFDFMRRFKISRRTAYNWRRKKLIPYLTIEDKVFYRLSEVRKFVEQQAGKQV